MRKSLEKLPVGKRPTARPEVPTAVTLDASGPRWEADPVDVITCSRESQFRHAPFGAQPKRSSVRSVGLNIKVCAHNVRAVKLLAVEGQVSARGSEALQKAATTRVKQTCP